MTRFQRRPPRGRGMAQSGDCTKLQCSARSRKARARLTHHSRAAENAHAAPTQMVDDDAKNYQPLFFSLPRVGVPKGSTYLFYVDGRGGMYSLLCMAVVVLRMTIGPRIPTMPGRSTSGFHRPGRAGGGRGGRARSRGRSVRNLTRALYMRYQKQAALPLPAFHRRRCRLVFCVYHFMRIIEHPDLPGFIVSLQRPFPF